MSHVPKQAACSMSLLRTLHSSTSLSLFFPFTISYLHSALFLLPGMLISIPK